MLNTPLPKNGFLISRHSKDRSGHTEITLWVITDEGPARLLIENQRPVFFVRTEQQALATRILQNAAIPHESKGLNLKTFNHEAATGVYFQTLDACYRAQDVLKNTGIIVFESDIRLHDRYLMERFVNAGLQFIGEPVQKKGFVEYRQAQIKPFEYTPTFKVVSLDIECSACGELYSVGLSGLQADVVLMIGNPKDHSESDNHHEHWIQWVDDEKALLEALEYAIQERDPDIIIGWNVINFDFRVLLSRAQNYGSGLRLGRNRQYSRWRNRAGDVSQGFVTLPGRMVIDGIDALKSATYQFDSFSLESVARTLLGKGKATEDVDNRMAVIAHDFIYNKIKLAKYNLEDCRLVEEVFNHTRLLDYLRLRSQLTGLELDRIGGSVAAFTNLYLPRLHRAGYIAPNLPEDGGLASPGGYVMDSSPGLYRNVLVLDFKSLYPSIIRTFKVDPLGLIEGLNSTQNTIPGYRGALFSRTRHFLPDIITALWKQRDEAKQQHDAPRSQAIKIIMNSFYGVLGSGGCRFYDTRLASSITLRGHDIMQETARWIERAGHRVIYGDTDSTFVLLDEHLSPDQATSIGNSLAEMINERWQQTLKEKFGLECYLEIEFETLYTRFLMPTIRGAETGSKKRYAGLKMTPEGERLIFKGLETVRSDWTALSKLFQISRRNNW